MSAKCAGVHDNMTIKTTISTNQAPALLRVGLRLSPICPHCDRKFGNTIELALHFVKNHRSEAD